jgi:death-on-curing protein
MPDRLVTWIAETVVLAIHDEQLAEHGGLAGVRSPELLSPALARPRHLQDYDDPGIADLAASYAYGTARNPPFADGNERTALVVAETFLLLNGYILGATDADCVSTFLALAAGELAEQDLAAWIGEHIEASRT